MLAENRGYWVEPNRASPQGAGTTEESNSEDKKEGRCTIGSPVLSLPNSCQCLGGLTSAASQETAEPGAPSWWVSPCETEQRGEVPRWTGGQKAGLGWVHASRTLTAYLYFPLGICLRQEHPGVTWFSLIFHFCVVPHSHVSIWRDLPGNAPPLSSLA